MGLGLQWAAGLQGGWDALGEIIASRKKDELLAEARAQKEREFQLQQQREQLALAQFAETLAYHRDTLAGQDEARQQTKLNNEQQQQNRIEDNIRQRFGNLPSGYKGTAQDLIDAQKVGMGGLFTPDPIVDPNAPQTFTFAGTQATQRANEDRDQRKTDQEANRQLRESLAAYARENMFLRPRLVTKVDPVTGQVVQEWVQPPAPGGGGGGAVGDGGGGGAAPRSRKYEIVSDDSGQGGGGGMSRDTSFTAPPPAALRVQASDLAVVPTILDQIDELSGKINTGRGISGMLSGMGRQTMGKLQYDTDAGQYEALTNGFKATIARLAGERGVLTEGDANRAMALLPQFTDSQDLAQRKLTALREFLSSKFAALPAPYRNPFAQSSGTTGGGDSDITLGSGRRYQVVPPKSSRYSISVDQE